MRRYAIIALSAAILFQLWAAPVPAQGIELAGISSGIATDTNQLTYSHTPGSGDNRHLIVGISYYGTKTSISSVAFKGFALSEVGTVTGKDTVSIWGLDDPPETAGNVVVTLDSDEDIKPIRNFFWPHGVLSPEKVILATGNCLYYPVKG